MSSSHVGKRAEAIGRSGVPIKSSAYRCTYAAWFDMKRRCLDPKSDNYPRYGGRGIKVCERWMTFKNFLSDMGIRPDRMSIERENNDGDYEPGNCRWATAKEQCRNTSRNTYLEHDGLRLTVTDWAERIGVHPTTIRSRLSRMGMSVAEALTPGPQTSHSIAALRESPEAPHFRRCRVCKAWDDPENMSKAKGHKNSYYHKLCVRNLFREKRGVDPAAVTTRSLDLTGQRFGRLVVGSSAGVRNHGATKVRRLWNVLCDCGTSKIVTTQALRSGDTQSCGCLHSDTLVASNRARAAATSEKKRATGETS